MVKTALPLQGAWVQPLVGELRSHMPCSMVKKLKKKKKERKKEKKMSQWWFLGAGAGEGDMENYCSMAMEFQFRTTKDF